MPTMLLCGQTSSLSKALFEPLKGQGGAVLRQDLRPSSVSRGMFRHAQATESSPSRLGYLDYVIGPDPRPDDSDTTT